MKKLYLILFFIGIIKILSAQCTGGTNNGAITPAPSAVYQTMNCPAGNFYYTFVVTAGACFPQYEFSFCSAQGGSASFDTQLTILDNTGGTVTGGFNDDNCSLQSRLFWTPTVAGTYRLRVNQYSCVATTAAATLAYRVVSSYTNTAEYTINANATSSGSCTTLTSNTSSQKGCAWDVNSTLNFTQNFSYDFRINLGLSDAGADGMAFVIQNDPLGRCACGTLGGSLGAGGITNSLIVEIDTYLNTEDRDDGAQMTSAGVLCTGGLDPDHIDIWLNGVVNPAGGACPGSPGARIIPSAAPTLSAGANYNIENGNDHILRVSWAPGAPGTLTASILNTALNYTFATVSYAFNPMTVFGTNTPLFGFTASTGGASNLQTFCNPFVLLPIEITSFNAECKNQTMQITWTNSISENTKHFELERSDDGIIFTKITTIPVLENNSISQQYIYNDKPEQNKTYYYRLIHYDKSNYQTYITKIVSATSCTNNHIVNIYPNPANNQITITSLHSENINVELISNRGELLFSKEIKTNAENEIKINTDNFLNGIYVIRAFDGETVKTQKIIIEH